MWIILGVLSGVLLVFLALIGAPHLFRGAPVGRVIELDGKPSPFTTKSPGFSAAVEISVKTNLEPGAAVEVMHDGQVFERLWQDLHAARQSITIVMYYAGPGPTAEQLAAILKERAGSGVPTYYVYDPIGSSELPHGWFTSLREAGVHVAEFRPLRWYRLDRANHRTHVRSVVIDGAIGYTGGFGFDDQWLGDGRSEGCWRDVNVRITGPPVRQLQEIFVAHWTEATGQLLVGDLLFTPEPQPDRARKEAAGRTRASDTARVGMMTSPASVGASMAERMLALSIATAGEALWITSAYFVPDADFVRMLCGAAARNVDVRILTNGRRTDVKLTWHAGRLSYEKLLGCGVRIFEYRPTVIHSKTLVADGRWTAIGTVNVDNRSLAYNEEVCLLALDEPLGRYMMEVFEDDCTRAREIRLDAFRRRPIRLRILEAFGYLLWRWL
jgi:cardiolipin synthase